jgi:hypothetical protein
MTSMEEGLDEVTHRCLQRWQGRLQAASARPLLLVAVGQGGRHPGQVHVIYDEDIDRGQLAAVVRRWLRELERGSR